MKKTIVIVDDHILVANALSSIISNFQQFKVIYTCVHGADLKQKLQNKNVPDIVLLDISMPVMDGFETAQWLKQNYPNILVMALSMQNDDMSLIKMIKNGAKGYLLKNIHPSELEKALSLLVQKGNYFPNWATEKVFANMASSENELPKVLFSNREIEFLKYSATEMSYKQIAELMFCSPRTVENYRDSLFEKLNLKSRVGLAIYALKNGFAS